MLRRETKNYGEIADWERRGKFDPGKYTYKTFDELRHRTFMYLHGMEPVQDPTIKRPVEERIKDCAAFLLGISRKRILQDKDRWEQFRRYPGRQ